MNTLTLTGKAYPTHNTPFPDGWYIKDTTAVGFLSDHPEHLNHLVSPGETRATRVINRTIPEEQKSISFIRHNDQYWVKESWDTDRLHSFHDHYFIYDNEFIFQPLDQPVSTVSLAGAASSDITDDALAVTRYGRVDETFIIDKEDLDQALDNNLIHRLQSTRRFEQF